ncbi:MAG: FG-GAP-like repeat-containing protein [bacterium]
MIKKIILILLLTIELSINERFVKAGILLESTMNLVNVQQGFVAYGDYDNDNDLDLVLCGDKEAYDYTSKVYRNDDGVLNEDTSQNLIPLGLLGSATWGDYDNDGDLDLAITGYGGENIHEYMCKLYRNDNGILKEDTSQDLQYSGRCMYADYDNDGDLDIITLGRIYRNDNGTFNEDPGQAIPGVERGSLICGDYDNDGDLDLALCGLIDSEKVCKIYRNDNSIFYEDTSQNLVGVQNGSLDFGDYDNDGDLDLVLTGESNSAWITKIYDNNGGIFVESQNLWGVTWSATAFGDYDNDGDLDLLLTGWYFPIGNIAVIYRNDNGIFIRDENQNLQGVSVGAVAWADIDNDNDIDLIITGDPGYGTVCSKVYLNNESDTDGFNNPNVPALPPTSEFNSSYENGILTLSWGNGSDEETSSPGLYYNIRVGTVPGRDNIVPSKYGTPLFGVYYGLKSKTLKLKNLKGGTYYWNVQSIDSSLTPGTWSIEQQFTIESSISIIPTYGLIGTIITVSGEGFGEKESIQIDFGTTLTITTVPTDLSGKFTTIFTVDTQSYGTTSIIATSLNTGEKATDSFFITGGGIYLVTPTFGTIGTKITIAGNGYGRTEDIVIHFGTIRAIAISRASDAGTFSATFTFPLMVRGTKTVTATGLKTQVEATAFFNVLCSTRLEIKPESKIVTKGDEFGLDIWLKDVVNLAGLDVFLEFDHNRLEVLDDNPGEEGIQITQGPFPAEASLLYAAATNTSGQIAYSLILVPATNTATGSGILAKIRFKAKASGTATISFVFDKPDNRWTVVKDSDNQPIPVATYGGTVTIFEYGSMEGYVIIEPPKDTGTNAGISITLVGVGTASTGIGGYYTFLEVIPGTYTLQADTSGVSPGTITGIVVYPGTKTQVATLTLLNGDSNNDGVVDIEDFMVLRNAYLSVIGDGRWNEEADYNGDERINIDDAMILRNSFFKTQPSPAPASPAPAPPVKLPVKTAKTKLTFNPSAIDTFVGTTFSVKVLLEDVEDLAACQAQLSFDPNLLEVVNITPGPLTLPVIKSQFGYGRIDYASGLLEGSMSGSEILAEIEFKVKNPGITYLTFDFNPTTHRMTKMLNINSQPILFDVNEVKVKAKPISTLDHFEFDNITSPKAENIPFNVKIKALDVGNNLVDYNDTGTLTLHNIGGTITPRVITFGSGTWQGTVAISGTGTTVFICVRSSGKGGTSSLFEVKAINVPKESNEDIVIKSEDEKAIVVIEKGSPNQDAYVEVKKITIPPTPLPNIPQDLSPVVIEIKVITGEDSKLEIKGSMTLTYLDEQVKGLDESRLRIFYYNGSIWKLASAEQEVDIINNRITAYNITHFSIYSIGSLVAPNLSNVQVYPNPYKPTTIHAGKYVTFKNLTSYWNLKIFNLAGELVDEKTGDTNEAHWNGNNQSGNPCASGVYIYLIINDRNEKVTGRVVVIR